MNSAQRRLCRAFAETSGDLTENAQVEGLIRYVESNLLLLPPKVRTAIKLKERREQMSLRGYQVACGRLEAAWDRLLEAGLTDPENVGLAQRLRKHRHQLFTFLYEEAVEATNNRAERALRPAVIVRKLQAGNRTERGAKPPAHLARVMQTCRQRGQDSLAEAQRLLCSPQPLVLPQVKATARAPTLTHRADLSSPCGQLSPRGGKQLHQNIGPVLTVTPFSRRWTNR